MQGERAIRQLILETGMLTGTRRVLCGVSGGADSVFLLLFLKSVSEEYGFSLRAAHIHHGIRGEEADRDAAFVRELCEREKIPCVIRKRDIPREAKERGISLEEAGRDARREIFLELARTWGSEECEAALSCGDAVSAMESGTQNGSAGGSQRDPAPGVSIALAHHQNDLAESVLFRLARGTGVRGLAAIRPVRDFGSPPIRVIRPLLTLSRAEIESALTAMGQTWREDRTNAENDAARNRIRHDILPLLAREINSAAVRHLGEAAKSAAEVSDFLDEECARRYPRYVRLLSGESVWSANLFISEELIKQEPPAMRTEILRRALSDVSPSMRDVGTIHLRELTELFGREGGKRIDLPHGLLAERAAEGIRLRRVAAGDSRERIAQTSGREAEHSDLEKRGADSHDRDVTGIHLMPGNSALFQNVRFSADFEPSVPSSLPEKRYTKTVDYGTINNTLVIRNRRAGDYLITRSDGARKSLSDYFTDEKVPREMRDRIIVVADGSEIVWVVGMRIGYRYRVTESTTRALTISAEVQLEV